MQNHGTTLLHFSIITVFRNDVSNVVATTNHVLVFVCILTYGLVRSSTGLYCLQEIHEVMATANPMRLLMLMQLCSISAVSCKIQIQETLIAFERFVCSGYSKLFVFFFLNL